MKRQDVSLAYAQGDYEQRLSPVEKAASVLAFIVMVVISTAMISVAVADIVDHRAWKDPISIKDSCWALLMGAVGLVIVGGFLAVCGTLAHRIRALRASVIVIMSLDVIAFLICIAGNFV